MPVDLRIDTEGNPENKRVEVTGTSSEFSLDTFGKPRKVTIDPNHVLLRTDPAIQVAVAIKRGEQFVEVNDFSNALREYQKALEVNKNSSLAHFRIARALLSVSTTINPLPTNTGPPLMATWSRNGPRSGPTSTSEKSSMLRASVTGL